jgi:hypothetical protein
MNRFRKVGEAILSHTRDIRMELFQNKIVYSIPKYMVAEKFLYTPQVDIKDHSIEVSFSLKEPTLYHSAKSSYEKPLTLKENIDGNENSFQ